MGITIIHAVNSRWVIDLNRAPDNTPLYSDGRIITGLCPTTDFLGQRIYKDERSGVEQTEIDRRIDRYFQPYHRRLAQLLEDLRSKFEQVLLWDCHSIRHTVPTIRKERFPDFILGDADGTSASPGLIETALAALEQSDFEVSHNYPFKGGHITRNFGKPVNGIHALQLEMNKINYMDDPETRYDEKRAEKIRVVLKRTFDKLIERLL
jgi:N-formylglutamate amidohydrolase